LLWAFSLREFLSESLLGVLPWDHTFTTSIELSLAEPGRLAFQLFIGVAMSVTAFPVLARIVSDYRLIRLPVGCLVMACAAVDDMVADIFVRATGGGKGVYEEDSSYDETSNRRRVFNQKEKCYFQAPCLRKDAEVSLGSF
jgi:hypothetical protein